MSTKFEPHELDLVRGLLDYNPDTGVFIWKVARAYVIKPGDIAGTDLGGYTRITVAGRLILAHRLAWFYVTGEWPEKDIDHVNGKLSDNRLCNLRLCTHSQNMANKKVQENNKASLKGVSWDKKTKKWRAQISKDGKKHHLGFFTDSKEAHGVYIEAAKRLHGEFARAA
jgi:hypothetical protein